MGHVAVTRNQIRRATARGVVLVGIQETYVANNRFVHCKSALQLLKAGSRPAAVVENVILDGTDTSIWVEATAPGKAARVIGNRIVGRGMGVGAHGAQLTLLRNTITMVGKQGVSLHLQNSSSAILAGNLISGESAALTIARSNVRSTQLRSDVVLGNIVAGDQNPSASPVTKRIRVLVERNSEPVSRVRSSLRAASHPVTATNRLIAFKALDSADRKLRFEASQLAQVRLLVEDSIGRRIQPSATLVYEGRSPAPGSVALFPEEIKAGASLLAGLRRGSTPALKTLQRALKPETLAAVSSSPPSPSKALLAAVVRDLNRWISGPLVELAEGFSDVSVGARHAQLLEERRYRAGRVDLEKLESEHGHSFPPASLQGKGVRNKRLILKAIRRPLQPNSVCFLLLHSQVRAWGATHGRSRFLMFNESLSYPAARVSMGLRLVGSSKLAIDLRAPGVR